MSSRVGLDDKKSVRKARSLIFSDPALRGRVLDQDNDKVLSEALVTSSGQGVAVSDEGVFEVINPVTNIVEVSLNGYETTRATLIENQTVDIKLKKKEKPKIIEEVKPEIKKEKEVKVPKEEIKTEVRVRKTYLLEPVIIEALRIEAFNSDENLSDVVNDLLKKGLNKSVLKQAETRLKK